MATVTTIKKSVNINRVVFELRERTDIQSDRQTNRHTRHNTPHHPSGGGRSNNRAACAPIKRQQTSLLYVTIGSLLRSEGLTAWLSLPV